MLDLDDVGTPVRHHRARGRYERPGCDLEHPDSVHHVMHRSKVTVLTVVSTGRGTTDSVTDDSLFAQPRHVVVGSAGPLTEDFGVVLAQRRSRRLEPWRRSRGETERHAQVVVLADQGVGEALDEATNAKRWQSEH